MQVALAPPLKVRITPYKLCESFVTLLSRQWRQKWFQNLSFSLSFIVENGGNLFQKMA